MARFSVTISARTMVGLGLGFVLMLEFNLRVG
jgi:hypothetical protein